MEIHEQRRSFTGGHGARGSVDLLVEHTVSDRPLLLAIMFHFLGRLQYIISLSFVFFLLFSSSLLVTMGHPHHFLAPLEAFLHFLKSCWAWVSGKEGPTSRSVGDNRSNKDWVLHGTPYTACCS